MKKNKLIILGDSSFAEVAYEYFSEDSSYEVVAFSVERNYQKKNQLFGLPIVAFEELENNYPPNEYHVFVAIPYTQLNRLRTRLYHAAKQKGYALASYVSPHAVLAKSCKLGDHCFIFENNVIQSYVVIGNNVILWSGNHIGHHSVIKDNCFIASHVVISGHCVIGENCFLGVNSTVSDQVHIGHDCLIGAGALILKDCEEAKVFKAEPTVPATVSSLKIAKVKT